MTVEIGFFALVPMTRAMGRFTLNTGLDALRDTNSAAVGQTATAPDCSGQTWAQR